MTPQKLIDHLRATLGVRHKLDIQPTRALLDRVRPDPTASIPIPLGDDCAGIPDGDGFLLFAIEGMLSSFVESEPWFAGYCAVMVNISDIYAMGGRPIALVDAIWTASGEKATPIWDGMTTAAAKYGIPIVGGHTNSRSASGDHLAAAILGRAGNNLLTSFDARPGETLIAAIDLRGEWFGDKPYWNCSTTAPGPRLRHDLEILVSLAESGLCRAAKDISMGGLLGTATMLAECSGVGMRIDLDAIPRPPLVAMEKWLTAFPSFGFLLSVDPLHADEVLRRFTERQIAAARVGSCDASGRVVVESKEGSDAVFWDLNREPFIGFGGSV